MIDDSSLVIRNSSLKPVYVNDNLSMLNIETGRYTMLNSVGTEIWKYVEEPKTVKNIVTKLMNEFDVTDKACRESVISYLKILKKERLIEIK